MTIKLEFEKSNSGQQEGINDAGIETFAGSHLESLAREQGQNSMDARAPKSKGPVDVRYSLLQVPIADLPGSTELKISLGKIKAFWNEPGRVDNKALNAANRALKILTQKVVPVLRISDRNTTGLRGSDQEMTGDWYSLTKSSGVSLKGDGKLGSFGIGKNVFWANSRLRMVYFSTHDIDDLWAFQGVAKWASHRITGKAITRAIGFCGAEKDFSPLRGKKTIPATFQSDGIGTDIFVAGFDNHEKWQSRLIRAFAENFFVAFHDNLLRVEIEGKVIKKSNIGGLIDAMTTMNSSSSNLKNYYDALVSSEAHDFSCDFEKLGTVKLRLLLREGASKSIAMFRAIGMMIFEKKHFRTPMQFAGVCICDNKKGNEFLRRLEPPSHNAWEPERYDEDPAAAQAEIHNLYKWLRDCVNTLSPAATVEALDVPELEKFLPDDGEDDDRDSATDHPAGDREGDPSASELRLEGRARREQTESQYEYQTEEMEEDSGDEIGDSGGPDFGPEPGDGGGGDGSGSSDDREKPPLDGGSGEKDEPVAVPVNYRIFRQPGPAPVYLMRADLPSKGSYSFAVSAIGDDGTADLIRPEGGVQRLPENGKKKLIVDLLSSRLTGVVVSKGGPVTLEVEILSKVPLSLNARFFCHE
jgi:hypothetical protein